MTEVQKESTDFNETRSTVSPDKCILNSPTNKKNVLLVELLVIVSHWDVLMEVYGHNAIHSIVFLKENKHLIP